jgi:hypothetical protein
MVVIRVSLERDRLGAREQYGLALLLDASRLLPVDDPAADVVRLALLDPAADRHDSFDGFVRGTWNLERSDGVVAVSRALLHHVAEITGGAAEFSAVSGNHVPRVPPEANPLVRVGRFREPVVTRLAAALRSAALAVAGRRPIRLLAPWPQGRRWAAAFTHDLDIVAWWPLFTLLRLAELGRHRAPGRALRVLTAAAGSLLRNPVWAGVRELLGFEANAGVRSTWFVLCGTPTFATARAGDLTYVPESPAARRILEAVGQGGHEIGLHGSFATLVDADEFAAQRRRLAALIGRTPAGVRQHFLRLRPGATQRAMVTAGFAYDATLGFHDRNGFRLGAADIVPGWDPSAQAPLPVDEVPLIWMDRALSKYARVEDPWAWVEDGLQLARLCQEVQGLWVGLWHPNLTPALGYPGAPEAYRHLVQTIVAERPYVGSLTEIVEWRAARRSVRASVVSPEGTLRLVAGRSVNERLTLEGGDGKALETHPWPAAHGG